MDENETVTLPELFFAFGALLGLAGVLKDSTQIAAVGSMFMIIAFGLLYFDV